MPSFGGHFNPKSLAAHTLSCEPQFAQIPMLPSSDSMQYFISRINACVMNHVIVAVRPIGYICFTTSRRKSHESVKRFERSNGLDTALYKTIPLPFYLLHYVANFLIILGSFWKIGKYFTRDLTLQAFNASLLCRTITTSIKCGGPTTST